MEIGAVKPCVENELNLVAKKPPMPKFSKMTNCVNSGIMIL